jgi:hypothetical protein
MQCISQGGRIHWQTPFRGITCHHTGAGSNQGKSATRAYLLPGWAVAELDVASMDSTMFSALHTEEPSVRDLRYFSSTVCINSLGAVSNSFCSPHAQGEAGLWHAWLRATYCSVFTHSLSLGDPHMEELWCLVYVVKGMRRLTAAEGRSVPGSSSRHQRLIHSGEVQLAGQQGHCVQWL